MRITSKKVLGWLMLGLSLALLGATGAARAAYPATTAASPSQQDHPQPVIADPYHHISGVIAVSPDTMIKQAGGSDTKPGTFPLALPTFGPNVDATLNNPAAQNETTIAINPENDQQVIASANDYRSNLKPFVYYSTNGG